MGFFDNLFGKERERPSGVKSAQPSVASLKTGFKFSPLRMTALKDGAVTLVAKVTNNADQAQLVSMDVELPQSVMIGFDSTCLKKSLEKKVGEVKSGETKEFAVTIYGSNQTKSCTCRVGVETYAHYRDYDKVIDKKREILRLRIS
ncbi:MAG TPA: hypothetical protein VI912_01780 [Candidatus Bilamarchaeaceae archaeon]|nr:hypothetical protein [Candidatus Bilamarchaeaceae archaeon]